MADTEVESEGETGRHRSWGRIALWVGVGILVLVVIALALAWIQRRPIARDILERELAKSGVEGRFELDRVGLRTQQLSNLRIGDPENPDLTAERVQIQMRPEWDGSIDVYRIVARGVRLRGRVLPDGSVSWGELDKLLPEPSGEPFSLPDVAVDIADSSIALRTPWGPLGFAIRGSGNLTGGFKGRFVSSSPRLQTEACTATNVRGAAAIEITARRPHVVGPLTADRFACPQSNFSIVEPRLRLDARFGESFDSFDAEARLMSQRLTAGVNSLAGLDGTITLEGNPKEAEGRVELEARGSRIGSVRAERTVLEGDYKLSIAKGTLVMTGEYAARDASLDPSLVRGFTESLMATSETPIGPVATNIATAIARSARSFDVSGGLRLVNFRGGGAIRIENAEATTATGARIRISDGRGITYHWPSGKMKIDGTIRTSGGGLPTGFLVLSSTPEGGFSGRGRFQPYVVHGSRLDVDSLRFQAQPDGTTRFAATATVSGGFDAGRVTGLHVPIMGRIGPDGGIWVGERCTVISWDSFRLREIQLGAARLPVCPTGPAILYQRAGGSLTFAARIANPRLSGRLGSSPLALNADSVTFSGAKAFTVTDLRAQLGDPDAPVVVTADRLRGTFSGPGINGTISGGTAIIGNVPLRATDIDGDWRLYSGDLGIDGNLLVSDRADPPRFYPLESNDVRFLLSNNRITTTGTLRHPESGTKVTDVRIEHDLGSGAGHANLDVPGITFGENLQPEELTRLTEGVVALVQGTLRGQGRIDWSGSGEVTSTGDFHTRDMDLAAPFGPVEGLTTSIHFTDLLGLESAPGQVAQIDRINPGIIVENGIIRYQLLPDQLVKIERGEWPFMGGRLILHETVLNFGSGAPKRLTFELVGFNAGMFVDSLGFDGLEITGIFDGVLPMIFDDEGGRIVGGRLESRPPGGHFRYTGTEPDAGLMVGVAFDLLSDMRYRNMVIRLDGDLAGEFATRFTIEQISLGQEGGLIASVVRGALRNVPLRVNLNITGPFRALIQMAKGFRDPTAVIEPVMPFPLDAPGIVTETRMLRKEEEQERMTPIDEVDVSTQPPQPSE